MVEARVDRLDDLLRPLLDSFSDNLGGAGLALAPLASAGSTDATLLHELQGADLRVGVVRVTLLADGDHDRLPVLLNEVVVLAFDTNGFQLCCHAGSVALGY